MSENSERPSSRYARLIAAAQELPPIPTAVVHPCDEVIAEFGDRGRQDGPDRADSGGP